MTSQASQQQAFGQLLEQHRGIVLKVAHSYCRDPEDRADLAQEIAAQLWRAFPNFDPQQRFSTWMYRIALNVGISHLRKAQLRQRHMVSEADTEALAVAGKQRTEQAAQWQFLEWFLKRLDPLHRALLMLYLEERSYADIAEILGLSESNVATKISRLKQRIRQASDSE